MKTTPEPINWTSASVFVCGPCPRDVRVRIRPFIPCPCRPAPDPRLRSPPTLPQTRHTAASPVRRATGPVTPRWAPAHTVACRRALALHKAKAAGSKVADVGQPAQGIHATSLPVSGREELGRGQGEVRVERRVRMGLVGDSGRTPIQRAAQQGYRRAAVARPLGALARCRPGARRSQAHRVDGEDAHLSRVGA
jgi:hypothetical protein